MVRKQGAYEFTNPNRDIDFVLFFVSNRSYDRKKISIRRAVVSIMDRARARTSWWRNERNAEERARSKVHREERIPQLSLGEYGFVVATVSRAGSLSVVGGQIGWGGWFM